MAGIDQVKHPMRFAVVTSTVSGLLVALLTATAGKAFRSSMSWHALLPWLLLPGWPLAALSLILRARHRERRPGRVFFIVAAFTHKHWVPELIRDLHENLERRGYDMVLKIPDRDYSGASQIRLLDGILSRRREYAGGFIMVNEALRAHGNLRPRLITPIGGQRPPDCRAPRDTAPQAGRKFPAGCNGQRYNQNIRSYQRLFAKAPATCWGPVHDPRA